MPSRSPTIAKSDVPTPPQSLRLARTPRLYTYQWIGIPVLALVVLLALLGTFGQSEAEVSGRGAGLALKVEYPTKFRYKQIAPLRVRVTNTSGARIDTVAVVFEQSYIDRFSQVSFTPSAEQAYQIPLTAIEPGESRLVSVTLQAERYGSNPGRIVARSGGRDSAAVAVSTFVFP